MGHTLCDINHGRRPISLKECPHVLIVIIFVSGVNISIVIGHPVIGVVRICVGNPIRICLPISSSVNPRMVCESVDGICSFNAFVNAPKTDSKRDDPNPMLSTEIVVLVSVFPPPPVMTTLPKVYSS
jgi:hypothetical protein